MVITIPAMTPKENRTRQYSPETFGNEIVTYRSTYTEKAEGVPQILLVEQPGAGSTLLPHYHASDQFQVFMDGSGKLGAHSIKPVSVHYTNRYTGYGPIVAGDEGVNYYVLRPTFDVLGPGQYLFRPEVRDRAKAYRGKRRTFVADDIEIRQASALERLEGVEIERLFAVEAGELDEGTLAEVACLGPGRIYKGHDPRNGGGQVHLMLAGAAAYDGRMFGPRSAIAVTRDERAIEVGAGPTGLQMLVLQYPRWR